MHPFWVSGYWTPGLVINITSSYALWVSLASVSKWKDTRISRLCAASVFDICIWWVFFYYGKKILSEMAFFSYSLLTAEDFFLRSLAPINLWNKCIDLRLFLKCKEGLLRSKDDRGLSFALLTRVSLWGTIKKVK